MPLRVKVNVTNVRSDVDVAELARQLGEILRNLTGGEVNARVLDNTPSPPQLRSRKRR